MSVPVLLPRVLVDIDQSGRAEVSGEGLQLPQQPVQRSQLGGVLARITESLGVPVRVEVHEADGSCYADILEPRPAPAAPSPVRTAGAPAPALRAGGFQPGETVLIMVVAMRLRADGQGNIVLADAPASPRQAVELILLGARSRKTLHCRRAEQPGRRRWWRR